MVRRVTRRLTDLARRRKEPPPRPLRPTAAAVSDRLRRLTKLPAACSSHTFEPVVADQRDTAEHAAVSLRRTRAQRRVAHRRPERLAQGLKVEQGLVDVSNAITLVMVLRVRVDGD